MRGRLLSPWLTVRLQFVLAAFFVVAGIAKVVDPPGFAHEIHNYALVPGVAVNAMALVLPWLEIVVGFALFLSVATRTAARILALLLVVFIAALSINLARGRPVDCGCFGTSTVVEDDRAAALRHEVRDRPGRRPAAPRRADPGGGAGEASPAVGES